MQSLKSRNELPQLLNRLGLRGEGVEVGTAEGYNAWNILDNWPGKLTVIDPWRLLNAPGYSGHGEDTQSGQDARYQRILSKAATYKGRCQVMRATSAEAAPTFKDGSLDFAYIDSDHSLEAATEDLALWFPRVRSGGVISGHDMLSGWYNGQLYGVKDAVESLAKAHGLTVSVTSETDWPSFWIRKP